MRADAQLTTSGLTVDQSLSSSRIDWGEKLLVLRINDHLRPMNVMLSDPETRHFCRLFSRGLFDFVGIDREIDEAMVDFGFERPL